MSTTETVKSPNLVELKKKYEYFDENLVLQTKEVPVSYEIIGPIYPENATDEQKTAINTETLNKAVEFMTANSESYVDVANYLIRKKALTEAKKNAGVSGGINREVLMEFIKPYRELPQFASMITATDKRKATAEEWNKQTQAILDQIKNVPFIMTSIKERSAQENATEE